MSLIVKYPEPKTIAFVGVAIGNMNEKLVPTVKGIRRYTGLIPALRAFLEIEYKY